MYVLGEDIGMFYLPPIDAAQGSPVLVAGDTLMVPTPAGGAEVRPEVKAVAQFLATPYGPKAWIDIGSGIAANSTTPPDWYQSYKQGIAGDIVANATAVGFDASDLMPPAVGAGTFWSKMVEWIDSGGTNTDQILADIDASWPSQ
jgi:alpha-glucoside transport system substrate-binding protein